MNLSEMKSKGCHITWGVNDGRRCKDMVYTIYIPPEDFEGLDKLAAARLVDQCVKIAFDNTITYYYKIQ